MQPSTIAHQIDQLVQASHPAIFLTGGTGFLGGHFLLQRIRAGQPVHVLVRGENTTQARQRLYNHLADCAASCDQRLPKAELDQHLVVHLGDITAPLAGLDAAAIERLRSAGVSQFWHCAASLKFEDRHREEIFSHNITGTGNVLDLYARCAGDLPAAEFVHVSTAYSAGCMQGTIPEQAHTPGRVYNNAYEQSKNLAENAVIDFCQQQQLSYRILRPSIIMGPLATHRSGTTRFGVYGFTREVHRLRQTLAQLKHPLQLLGDPRATANLTPVDACVVDMLQLSAHGFGSQRFFHLCNPAGVDMAGLIATIDRMTGANRLAFVSQRGPDGGPLQELFDARTRFYAGYYNAEKTFARSLPPQPQVDWEDVQAYLRSFLQELEAEERGGIGYRPHSVALADGSRLRVFSTGSPTQPCVVLANAFGMPADFYWPLAQRLARDHHVVTWECRWAPDERQAFDPDNCPSQQHAHDLIQILDALQVEHCSIAGWSSGAQVALAAMALAPQRIDCGVLLNPGVSLSSLPGLAQTRFESGIRLLFSRIAGNYRMAEKYCELIYGAASSDSGDNQLLSGILTSTDPYLLYMTSLPFRSPQTLYRYANMMHTLFNEPAEALSLAVQQPVAVFVGGQDAVTHPDVGPALVQRLRHGQLHLQPQADHFAHYYDQAVADLIASHARQHARVAAEA